MILESQEKLSDVSSDLEGALAATQINEKSNEIIKDKKMKYLIADTAAFIKNVPMHEYAHNVMSIRDVIDEIRDKETRQRLLACPIEIEYRDPDVESLKKVTDFSKKSGDFGSLSATDIRVLALTYMMEVRVNGTEHLKDAPTIRRTTEFYKPSGDANQSNQASSKIPGFYMPSDGSDEESEDEEENNGVSENLTKSSKQCIVSDDIQSESKDSDSQLIQSSQQDSNVTAREVESDDSENEIEDELEEDDDEGWITPGNFSKKKDQMAMINEKELTQNVDVACMTSDFAMQNVLLSMGLHVASPTGQLIRETKTWILRCYACFKTTPLIEKKFCPKCGNKTLKRVSVTLNADGSQQIHISTRRQLNKKGKKFSLPKPAGGKHAVNPILCEDQQFAQQRKTKMARAKNDPMNPDYICGNTPFMKNDVTSVSAMMGVDKTSKQYWLRKNPNAVGKNTGNRKKKKDR